MNEEKIKSALEQLRIQTDENLLKAHKHHRFKEEILASKVCGCFYCLEIFPPVEIVKWVGRDGNKAICPKCQIDSVIGDLSGYAITKEFLHEMEKRWFLTSITGEGEIVYDGDYFA